MSLHHHRAKIKTSSDAVGAIAPDSGWFYAPLNPFYKDAKIYFHRSWRDHPIIGLGLGAPKSLTNETFQTTRHHAFATLCWHECTWLQMPGIGRNAGSYVLADNTAPIPNVAALWNWRVSDVRKYLSDLLSYDLIDAALFHALSDFLPKSQKSARETVPKATRSAVFTKTGGKCAYCAVRLTMKAGEPNSFEVDHVLPVIEGGADDIANLIPSCRSCNSKKRAKTLVNFMGVSNG